MAAVIADEYQDLVSVGYGGSIGDEKSVPKGREANFFSSSISKVSIQSTTLLM